MRHNGKKSTTAVTRYYWQKWGYTKIGIGPTFKKSHIPPKTHYSDSPIITYMYLL